MADPQPPPPPPPPPTSPLELPEILYNLVQFLNRKSLLQAALVCRSWSKLFSPMLFQEIRVQDWRYPGFFHLFQRNLPHVVKLEWMKSRLEAKRRIRETINLLPPRHRMNTDDDEYSNNNLQYSPSSMDNVCLEDLASILSPERTNQLRFLVVQGESNLRPFLITILPRIPTLTCLKIHDSFSWQKVGINEILNTCQSLQSLDCDSSISIQFTDEYVVSSPQLPTNKDGTISGVCTTTATTPTRHIKSLPTKNLKVLRLHKTSLSDQELLTFVRLCPQLEEIYLHQESGLSGGLPVSTTSAIHQWNWSLDFASDLAQACPKLCKLHLSPGCFQSLPEDILQRVLTRIPRLRSLGAPFSKFGDETMQMLIETRTGAGATTTALRRPLERGGGGGAGGEFASLTSLDIRNLKGHRLSSPLVQRFFESCATLIHFRGDDQLLDVQDMIDESLPSVSVGHSKATLTCSSNTTTVRPWACQHLETLYMGFKVAASTVSSSSSSSLHADHVIYQQLSHCPRLRRLELLSVPPSFFSLMSGLEKLSVLQVLQTYRVPKWEARSRRRPEDIVPAETIEWVARTWTCLEELFVPLRTPPGLIEWITSQLHSYGRTDIEVILTEN
ncbi:hypothetical protein BG004_000659 [Podila humilis]|nr:hypothetical protein BG004_000659 [Podila humilis]